MRASLIAILAVLSTTGCASVAMAAREHDESAKTFKVQQDTANVYVYRASSFGAAVKFPVTLDGKWLGELPGSTFLLTSVPPGQHTLVVNAENSRNQSFATVAGKNYYFKATPAMGFFSSRVNLYAMEDEKEAQEDIRGCQLIQPPAQ